jgi:diacylglycerol kinase (ATP)
VDVFYGRIIKILKRVKNFYFSAMNRKIAVFVNPSPSHSGALKKLQKVEQFIKQNSLYYEVFGESYPDKQILNNFSEVIIVGGDGTLNFFLNAYPDISLPISVITAGTGNDFARKLYGKITLEEQLQIAINAPVVAVDIGICNGKIFHNGVGIGFDGKVAFEMGNKRFFSGKAAYYSKVIPLVFSYREKEIMITINGKSRSEKALMITVANGSFFGGGFNITPLSDIQDGLFDVCLIKEVSIIKRIFNLSKIEQGRHLKLPFTEYFQTSEIRINSPIWLHAHLDGETFLAKEFAISMAAKTINFRSNNFQPDIN